MQPSNTEAVQTGRTIPPDDGDSGKDRLLDLLRANSKTNGWLAKSLSTAALARDIGLNEHEVVHLLHSLKKEHLVTFREGHNKQPIRIRLTPLALGKDYARAFRTEPQSENKYAHKGKLPDEIVEQMKEDRAHGSPDGSGMTLKELAIKYNRSQPVIMQYVRGIVPENMNARQRTTKPRDEAIARATTHQEDAAPDIRNPWIEPSPVWQDSIKFPIIENLAKRREMLSEAARLAEQSGADDLALALIEKAESPMSALEQEAVTLYNLYRRQ